MTDIETLIEKTERLLASATPGEFIAESDQHDDEYWIVRKAGWSVAAQLREADARLFAYAPTALRGLVKEAQGLQHSLADAMLQIDAIQGSNAVHMSRVAVLTQTLEEVQEALLVAKASVTELESAQTLRPMADVPIGATRVLARHTTLGWFPVARARDELEFRGRQGMDWSGEYFHGWIPMPVLPDQNGDGSHE